MYSLCSLFENNLYYLYNFIPFMNGMSEWYVGTFTYVSCPACRTVVQKF
jgi:hypothetical protein